MQAPGWETKCAFRRPAQRGGGLGSSESGLGGATAASCWERDEAASGPQIHVTRVHESHKKSWGGSTQAQGRSVAVYSLADPDAAGGSGHSGECDALSSVALPSGCVAGGLP